MGINDFYSYCAFFSAFVANVYGVRESEGFAGAALMMILFPLIFLIGFVILLIGFFKKEKD